MRESVPLLRDALNAGRKMTPMNRNAKFSLLIALMLASSFSGQAWAVEADLIWSTFLGGNERDWSFSIAVDGSGNAYVTGTTESADFPTTPGAFDLTYNGVEPFYWADVFVAKLNSTGSALVYSSFLGGTDADRASGIAVDGSGNAYLTGDTWSENFPVTPGALDITYSGAYFGRDIFVAKLDVTGSALCYATFLGEDGDEQGNGIAVDGSGNAYVTGYTGAEAFPATSGAFDVAYNGGNDVFVAKLNATGSSLDYATFLGGSGDERGDGIAVDGSGNVYVTGSTESDGFPTSAGAFGVTHNGDYDAFVAKLNMTGSSLVYSTLLGGGSRDAGLDIAVDGSGNAYVTGSTESDGFPTTAGALDITHNGDDDAFVVKLNSTGSVLIYSTFLGGGAEDVGSGIAADGSGHAYLTGHTQSTDFPSLAGAFDPTFNGSYDAYVVKLDPMGSDLSYATFLGGGGYDRGSGIVLDGSASAYVSGDTWSAEFPTTAGAFDPTSNGQMNAFVAKLSLTDTPVLSETAMVKLPKAFDLEQIYPNPFNACTQIRYQISTDGFVSLKIYNTLGQDVRTLVDAAQKVGGHAVTWDGRDDGGRELASGLYFCRLKAGGFAETLKMVLVR